MAAEMNGGGGEIPNWLVTLAASAVAALGGFAAALVNRSPALQALVDARLRMAVDIQERRVTDLLTEVQELRKEVVALRKALYEATGRAMPDSFAL